jgi:acyl carrier protein
MDRTIEPEKFLNVFVEQFEEKARKGIVFGSSFKQIEGWSSLQALVVTVAIHDVWGISFSDEDFRNSQTVRDLYDLTQQKINH